MLSISKDVGDPRLPKKKTLISTWTIDSISPSWVDKMKTILGGNFIFLICATKYFGFVTSFFSLFFLQ
jgi:hypothetical protein